MNVQPSGQTDAQELQRQGFAPGALGTVGNLRFKPEQGGTARAPRRAVPTGLRDAWTKLKFRFNRVSADVREQHDDMIQRRDNSRRIGNMLGLLTARTDDVKAQARVGRELEQLADLSQGDLANLPGAMQALSFYMGDLRRNDLDALRDGVLGNRTARGAVLSRISFDSSAWATGVLFQISDAVNQRLAQEVVQGPLWKICKLMQLPLSVKVAQKLAVQLISLFHEKSMLHIYLRTLPESSLASLSLVFSRGEAVGINLAIQEVASVKEKKQVQEMILYIRKILKREIYTRLSEPLKALRKNLRQARQAGNQFATSQALVGLGIFISTAWRTYRQLPNTTIQEVSGLVESSLPLFRYIPDNAEGPLNDASLSRLDDVTVENLREAASYLGQFGLELDEPGDMRRRRLF